MYGQLTSRVFRALVVGETLQRLAPGIVRALDELGGIRSRIAGTLAAS